MLKVSYLFIAAFQYLSRDSTDRENPTLDGDIGLWSTDQVGKQRSNLVQDHAGLDT